MSKTYLTTKELEIMNLLAKGLLYKEISSNKNITMNTVKKHASNIYKKLGVRNKTEALKFLREEME